MKIEKSINEQVLPANLKNGFSMDGYWVWCGSVVKGEDGRYHMFASRWKKSLPMHPGWLLESEIVRASSDTPDGVFKFEEVVLPARGAQYWDGRSTHNPHIIKFKDRYVLYYVGTTHPFPDVEEGEVLMTSDPRVICARANKRIGVAVSNSISGPWERLSEPVLGTRPEMFDNFLVSNPAPCVTPDGKILLVYKSRSYREKPYPKFLHGKMLFGVAVAEAPWEKHTPVLKEPLFDGDGYELEDPFLWHDGEVFHLMAKDMNGKVCGEKLSGVHAISKNGIDWNFDMGRLFYSRNLMFDDGEIKELGNMERPFILFENKVPICAYFAVSDGKDGLGFANCTRTWNMPLRFRMEDL